MLVLDIRHNDSICVHIQHSVWLTSIVFFKKILFWNTDFQKNSKTSPESSRISSTQRPLMLTTNIQWQNQDVNTINYGLYSNFTISPRFKKIFSPFQM